MTPDPAEGHGPDNHGAPPPAGADGAATRYDPASPAVDRESTRYGPQASDPHATRCGEVAPDSAATGYPPAFEQPAGRRGVSLPFRFGKYELVEKLAEGGMGVVYRAREETAAGSRLVALKMILGGQLASVEAVRRFLAEVGAVLKLEHEHIVPV